LSTGVTDLTAAARIRAAALEGFARAGYEPTSIRDVAAAAGVSPGLVQHHFPTKAALREAVDAHVVAMFAEAFSDLPHDASPDEFAQEAGKRITGLIRDEPLAGRYLARGIADGAPNALRMFDGMVAIATEVAERDRREGRMRDDVDPVWARLHVLVYNLGAILCEAAIDRHLPDPLRSPEGIERWREAATMMFERGMYRSASD
jgi:AcrR family transcriptional regulator